MKLEIDEQKIVREAVLSVIPKERIEEIAREVIANRIELVTAPQAAKLLKIHVDALASFRLPVVRLSEKKRRYKVSDIEKFINGATSK